MDKPLIPQGWLRAAFFFGFGLLFSGFLGLGLINIFFKDNAALSQHQPTTVLQQLQLYTVSQLGLMLAAWVCRKWIDRQSFYSLGFAWEGYSKDALLGFVTAVFILLIGTYLLIATKHLTVVSFAFNLPDIVVAFILFVVVALVEEIAVRGYLLNNLIQSTHPWNALIISSFVFSAMHIGNPDVSALSLLNIFIAGVFLGINYIYTKNLWFGIFAHFAWNFFQGTVLGYPVSGNSVNSSIVHQSISGPTYLTGGLFGFEASVVSTILQLLVIVLLWVYYERNRKTITRI